MKVGFTASAFDLLHAGHITMLRHAKEQCDYLICGLQVDPSLVRPNKNKPIQDIDERYVQLHGCKYVDEIIKPNETREKLIKAFRMLENKVDNLPRKKHGNIPL